MASAKKRQTTLNMTATSPPAPSQPEWASTMSDRLAQLIETSEKRITANIDARFMAMEDRIGKMDGRVTEVEDALSGLSTDFEQREARFNKMEEMLKQQMDKLIDLEDRSRRCNIRVLGIPEGAEGQSPSEFAGGMLMTVLSLPTEPNVDRAHRIGPRRAADAGPRIFIVRLSSWLIKNRLLKLARAQRGKTEFKGKKVLMFEDFSPATSERRALFRPAQKLLFERGYAAALLYPAKLRVTTDTGVKFIDNHDEALIFASSLPARSTVSAPNN